MKRKPTLRYIINGFCLCCALLATAQTQNRSYSNSTTNYNNQGEGRTATAPPRPAKVDTFHYHVPTFNGIMLGVNVGDAALRAFGQEYGGYEALAEVNIYNRFFPEISFGIGSGKSTADGGYTYECKPSFFGRIGMNYNCFYKNSSNSFVIVGIRYGFSSYKADISNLYYENGYWPTSGPYNLTNQKFTTHWLELGAGVRVQVFKNLYMGWMVYYKPLIKEGSTVNASPWYIPGYGINGKGFGFTYNIYYKLPFKGKMPNKGKKTDAPSK